MYTAQRGTKLSSEERPKAAKLARPDCIARKSGTKLRLVPNPRDSGTFWLDYIKTIPYISYMICSKVAFIPFYRWCTHSLA